MRVQFGAGCTCASPADNLCSGVANSMQHLHMKTVLHQFQLHLGVDHCVCQQRVLLLFALPMQLVY